MPKLPGLQSDGVEAAEEAAPNENPFDLLDDATMVELMALAEAAAASGELDMGNLPAAGQGEEEPSEEPPEAEQSAPAIQDAQTTATMAQAAAEECAGYRAESEAIAARAKEAKAPRAADIEKLAGEIAALADTCEKAAGMALKAADGDKLGDTVEAAKEADDACAEAGALLEVAKAYGRSVPAGKAGAGYGPGGEQEESEKDAKKKPALATWAERSRGY